MDTGKDQPPPKREPRVLDDIEVRDAQQEALSTLGKRFIGTPLGIVFMDENFTGTREYKSGLSRNYHATRTANEYGDEIILTSTIKRSDTKKGDYGGDILRIKRPGTLSGSERIFEHKTLLIDGTTTQTAPANTDVNRDNGLAVVRQIGRTR